MFYRLYLLKASSAVHINYRASAATLLSVLQSFLLREGVGKSLNSSQYNFIYIEVKVLSVHIKSFKLPGHHQTGRYQGKEPK